MNEPRVVLRQRREFGQIVEAALHVYVQHFPPLLQIAAVVVPLGVATAALQTAVHATWAVLTIFTVLTLAQAAVNLLVGAALLGALGAIDAGKQAEFSSAYDLAFERFWALIGAILRSFIIILLFAISVIGIPLAIIRIVRWLFVEQAVILEGEHAEGALRRSAAAVEGSWWRTLGIALALGLIGALPAGIIGGVFYLAPPLVSGTVNSVVNAVILPFVVIGMTLLYFDLQARKSAEATAGAAPADSDKEAM